jgi:hypothetical protein
VIDRWIHYDSVRVVFGYIIVAPLWQSFRVISSITLLWGTYTVVWRELEDRFSSQIQVIWWFGAKCAIFVVSLMSVYYVALFFSLSVVWMQFLSLETINELATKRSQFEIAMTALFFCFGVLTVGAATATLARAKRIDGQVRKASK